MDLTAALRSFSGPDGSRFARVKSVDEPARGEGGSYALVVDLPHAVALAIGRGKPTSLLPGRLVYCGSALAGLRARIDRHRRTEKRRHWHVDYLLEHGLLAEVWIARSPERLECLLADHLDRFPQGALAIPRFGSSDCRCPGHLVRWYDRIHGE